MEQIYTMNSPIITYKDLDGSTQMEWDVWKAVEGTLIMGAIGSGKTSGSARTIALKELLMGFGGLVLTTKPDEKDMWVNYCNTAGRLHDLRIIEPGGDRFNFLEYESTDKENSKTYTQNIVQLLKTVIKASEAREGGKGDDEFWERTLDMLMYNVIDLCILAYHKANVKDMYDIAISAPRLEGQNSLDDKKRGNYAHAIKQASAYVEMLIGVFESSLTQEEKQKLNTQELKERAIAELIPEAPRLKSILQFFNNFYFNLSDKTRSVIDISFSSFLFNLLQEPVYSLFCDKPSTVTPEDCLDGKIILINLPVKTYFKTGQTCQILFKYIWQRAIERRNVETNPRPVFLWADEAQNFLHEYDTEFQSTARSSRVATMYITQNLNNLYSFMSGSRFKEKVNSLLANFGTKIFHANTDIDTNKYASDLIGEMEVYEKGYNTNFGNTATFGDTENLRTKKRVRPENFIRLKSGGAVNNNFVEAIVVVQSKPFASGLHYRKVTFYQNYTPFDNTKIDNHEQNEHD